MSADTKRSLCYVAVFLMCGLLGVLWGQILPFPVSLIMSMLSGGVIGFNARKIVNFITSEPEGK